LGLVVTQARSRHDPAVGLNFFLSFFSFCFFLKKFEIKVISPILPSDLTPNPKKDETLQ
jgi:hypothetical protein